MNLSDLTHLTATGWFYEPFLIFRRFHRSAIPEIRVPESTTGFQKLRSNTSVRTKDRDQVWANVREFERNRPPTVEQAGQSRSNKPDRGSRFPPFKAKSNTYSD